MKIKKKIKISKLKTRIYKKKCRFFMLTATESYEFKIICILADMCKRELTEGKEYRCLRAGKKLYFIINNNNELRGYNMNRFKEY